MEIDLSRLHRGVESFIDISGEYELDSSFYENTEIHSLKPLKVSGKIERRENDDFELEDYCICTIEGEMILSDSISLEEVEYPFTIEYDDFLPQNTIKNENILDILGFLWENTVLEVPLQFTKVRDLSKFHGDGWRLISEDELRKENNPFNDLLKDFEEE